MDPLSDILSAASRSRSALLPPTRRVVGHLAAERVPNASGLFSLMRNLGGAIWITLIDTVPWVPRLRQ